MISGLGSVFLRAPCVSSETLKHCVAGLTDSAVAVFESDRGSVSVASFEACGEVPESVVGVPSSSPVRDGSAARPPMIGEATPFALSDEDLTALGALRGSAPIEGRVWRGFKVEIEGGRSDRVALALDPSIDVRLSQDFIQRVWPLLRAKCLEPRALVSEGETAVDGPEWDLLDRVDVAVLILDGAGLMYRMNSAARDLLKDGGVLHRGRGGIFASTGPASREFRHALSEIATEEAGSADRLVFLPRRMDGKPVPVTLSRYVHDGSITRFVVATVPVPPRREQVEALGRQLGLTAVEARVAALIQLGLTNREAARLAGLKEQTFNTYAKRVLSKLGFTCRTEMAQFLTWQAAGGRLS